MFEGSQLLSLPRGGVGLLRNIQGTAQILACYWPATGLLLPTTTASAPKGVLGLQHAAAANSSTAVIGGGSSSGHRAREGSSSGHRGAALPFARQPSAPFLAAPQQRPSTAFARDSFPHRNSYS